jgi:hypothetical protein
VGVSQCVKPGIGAVVAVTFGRVESRELVDEMVVDDGDSFQNAVGKLM